MLSNLDMLTAEQNFYHRRLKTRLNMCNFVNIFLQVFSKVIDWLTYLLSSMSNLNHWPKITIKINKKSRGVMLQRTYLRRNWKWNLVQHPRKLSCFNSAAKFSIKFQQEEFHNTTSQHKATIDILVCSFIFAHILD